MIFKKMYITIIFIIALLSGIDESDFEKYQKLEVKNVASIKKSDLPSEFSDEAFMTVDEFIRRLGILITKYYYFLIMKLVKF